MTGYRMLTCDGCGEIWGYGADLAIRDARKSANTLGGWSVVREGFQFKDYCRTCST